MNQPIEDAMPIAAPIDESPSPGHGPFDRSLNLRRKLSETYRECGLPFPFRHERYDPGDILEYEIIGVHPVHSGTITLEVIRFVGGGFAGQVYKVRIIGMTSENGEPSRILSPGAICAVKILKPPSRFSLRFRNLLYAAAFQSPFSMQVNPVAARVGVLWQKLIRRAASAVFEDDRAVCDTYATFHDRNLRSNGEINEWIDGRIWKFEVDDRLFQRWKFRDRPPGDHASSEYVHKKLFMARLVRLLHEMGAPELARQYEWWTCKSQPNALKRVDTDQRPEKGLTAIDFRAGLALLPFLPMSPADFWLILRGLFTGRWVQFDRSDLNRLSRFIDKHQASFTDLKPIVEELHQAEEQYRTSQIDMTGHRLRLLHDRDLRRGIRNGFITAWYTQGSVDHEHAERLRSSGWLFLLHLLCVFVPLLGRRLRTIIGDAEYRHHMENCFTDRDYFIRALRGARIQELIQWLREERISPERAEKLLDRPIRFLVEQYFLGWCPRGWHRFVTNPSRALRNLKETVRLTIRFLRVPEYREIRLLEQVHLGEAEGMLTQDEARRIVSEIKDPYIQKYLRCLAVHICTVPITQIFMLIAGVAVTAYCLVYRGMNWTESVGLGTAAAATIQLLPISPGSITRGIFVLFLMIKERDIKNYYIAAPVSFIHVIGYLAFPLQMVTHNPALARFLAGRWTRNMVHLVPVFGEHGGLLEHAVFDFFFNVPISIRRGFRVNPWRWRIASFVVSLVFVALIYLTYTRFLSH